MRAFGHEPPFGNQIPGQLRVVTDLIGSHLQGDKLSLEVDFLNRQDGESNRHVQTGKGFGRGDIREVLGRL
jgi:hypothetical protein